MKVIFTVTLFLPLMAALPQAGSDYDYDQSDNNPTSAEYPNYEDGSAYQGASVEAEVVGAVAEGISTILDQVGVTVRPQATADNPNSNPTTGNDGNKQKTMKKPNRKKMANIKKFPTKVNGPGWTTGARIRIGSFGGFRRRKFSF